jgi:peptidyl-prolyl cis-trans isomerase D
VTVGPFDANGLGPDRKPVALVTDKMVKSAFAQAANEDSELQDAGSGEYFALHVDKVVPPALPAIADIRQPLTQAYTSQTFMAAVRAKVDALVARIKKGEGLDHVAASVGSPVVHQPGLQLLKAKQAADPLYAALGKEFLEGTFSAKPGDVFAAGARGGVAVVKLDAVRSGDATSTAKVLEALRGRASQEYVRDIFAATQAAARDQIKVIQNLPLARQTIGVDPNLGKPGAKTPPKAS